MSVGKLAQKSAFKQSKEFTGGADKKIFKALKKTKINKKGLAKEILWFFGACFIALIAGFIIYYLIGEFLTAIFVDLVNSFGSITIFYWRIFLFSLIGVYVARLIIWAVKTVALGNR